jgi:LacI family transcriptional regulator
VPARFVRIGLVLNHSLAFYRAILRGVKTFAIERPEWVFTPIATDLRALELARPLRCSGYIAHVFSRPLASALRVLRRPVVSVSGILPDLPFPNVAADHVEVGRLAARHLLDRGVNELAFLGFPDHDFSVGREQGLREVAREAGVRVSAFHERSRRVEEPSGMWRWNQALENWLQQLPRPVGLLASYDAQGAQVAEYCRQLGLDVPNDVAIIGVDDDDLLCELARPSLSSVALPAERIGYEAARMLDELLRGKGSAVHSLILPPSGVVVRQSSSLNAVRDPHVAQAVQFIHDHAHEPLKVVDVLRVVPVARRALERRFRKWLQRSILDEISRMHIERAKNLLTATDLAMSQIAGRAGFRDSRHLSISFRRVTGMTPTAFRRRFRLRS